MKFKFFVKNLFLLFFLFSCSVIGAFEHELAICSIFQNEARFMKEWVEFHRLVGVEHFYLYNNKSDDDYLAVLSPYIQLGIVDLKDWDYDYLTHKEWNRIQCNAYEDCVQLTKKKVKWLALIDLDEFIVPVIEKDIKTILKQYQKYSALGVNWQNYGTSGIDKIPEGKLMTECLYYKLPTYSKKNYTTKNIVRPNRVSHIINPHWVFLKKGFKVNPEKQRFHWAVSPSVSIDKIRINHYVMRDIEYMIDIKHPRIAKRHPGYSVDEIMKTDKEFCQEFDDIMIKFSSILNKKYHALPRDK